MIMLQVNQVIRYNQELWRVDFVNECRARIVPLAKRIVTLDDVKAFEAERAGVNISSSAEVPIVTDLATARDEMELAEAEAELAAMKAALQTAEAAERAQAGRAQVPGKSADVGSGSTRATGAEAKPKPGPAAPQGRRGTGGWVRTSAAASYRPGSVGDMVATWITQHPGQTLAEIVAAIPSDRNITACIWNLFHAGMIIKS